MKKIIYCILLLILNLNAQLYASGSQEIIYYENEVSNRTDEVSLALKNIAEAHVLSNGLLDIYIIPWSSETYLNGTYSEMKAQRYTDSQIKQKTFNTIRVLDDCNNVEKNLKFLMIINLNTKDKNYHDESYTIDNNFFKYIFLDNDNGDFLRVTNYSSNNNCIIDKSNNQIGIIFNFVPNKDFNSLDTFFRNTKNLKLSINKFGLSNQSITYKYPINSIFNNFPNCTKNILNQLRSELKINFIYSETATLQNQKLYSKINKPEDPTKEGYIFKGWYKDRNFSQIWDFNNDLIHNDLNLYAKWEPKKYSIEIQKSKNIIQKLEISYNQTIDSKLITPINGYSLEGLYKDPNFIYKWDLNFNKIYNNQKLYAKWIKGINFRISNGSKPQSLDPAKVQSVPEHRILMALFEGLTSIDLKTAKPIPGLAKSWEANEDGTQYTFHLRHATWSDGVPITAQDIVWSWLRELDPATAAPYAWYPCMFLKGAQSYNYGTGSAADVGIRALDDYTFQMDLVGPLPYIIDALEHYSFSVVPKHAIEKYGDQWTQPENFVGNGPFVLKERIPQSKIVCVPNPNYWDADSVKIDTLEYLASDDDNTNYNMYLDGQIDWLTNVPTDKLSSASMRDDYKASPQLATYYYVFQTQKAPLDNVNLRKAISYAIDREALVEGVTKAGQIPAWGIVPPMAGYEALEFPEEITIDGTTYDNREDAARAYLAKAGYPNGIGCPTLEILYNTSEGHKQIAEFIQQEVKNKLNVNVELVNKEWGTYLTDRNAGNFEISRAGWVGDYQDPNTFLDMFLPGSAMNGGKYANDTYALFVKEAATISDPVERLCVLRTAEDIMVNEDAAILPLYYYVTQNMIDTSVWGGWHTNTMDYHPLKDIYKKH